MKPFLLSSGITLVLLIPALPGFSRNSRQGLPETRTFPSAGEILRVVSNSSAIVHVLEGEPRVEVKTFGDINAVSVVVEGLEVRINDVSTSQSKSPLSSNIIYVYVDNLTSVQNNGPGMINCHDMDLTSLSLKNFGNGSISVSNLDCTKLDLGQFGNGVISCRMADTTYLSLLNPSNGMITVSSVDSTVIDINNPGNGVISMTDSDATSINIVQTGSGMITVTGVCNVVTVVNSGVGLLRIEGLEYTVMRGNVRNGNIQLWGNGE